MSKLTDLFDKHKFEKPSESEQKARMMSAIEFMKANGFKLPTKEEEQRTLRINMRSIRDK
jgi:hypothetical protein